MAREMELIRKGNEMEAEKKRKAEEAEAAKSWLSELWLTMLTLEDPAPR